MFGAGVDAGPLLPDGSAVGEYNPVETLLTFFSMSDIHIVDKESPAQAIYGALDLPLRFWRNQHLGVLTYHVVYHPRP